jgi:putative FmdB family regulatory protein
VPIYEYTCEKCGITNEIQHGISEKMSPKCPKCGEVMERIISLNSFQLKGSGWYKTGYTKTPGDSGSKTGGAETAKTASPSETKTGEKTSKPSDT